MNKSQILISDNYAGDMFMTLKGPNQIIPEIRPIHVILSTKVRVAESKTNQAGHLSHR